MSGGWQLPCGRHWGGTKHEESTIRTKSGKQKGNTHTRKETRRREKELITPSRHPTSSSELCDLYLGTFLSFSVATRDSHCACRCPLFLVGVDSVTLLSAILQLMPLDQYVEQPVTTDNSNNRERGREREDDATHTIMMDGHRLFSFSCPFQAAVMRRVACDEASNLSVSIYGDFQSTLDAGNEGKSVSIEYVERHAFYERAKKCFAIVQTGERRQYGNIIIKKGVLRAEE